MDHEELACLAKQLRHEIETSGQASATLLYNHETSEEEIRATLARLIGSENLRAVDLKLVFNEFDEEA